MILFFLIFSAVLTFVFRSKANIFGGDVRNRFLLVCSPSNLSNSSWTWFDISARNSKTLSVELTSPFSLSKSSSNSLEISSNINVLLVLDSGYISAVKTVEPHVIPVGNSCNCRFADYNCWWQLKKMVKASKIKKVKVLKRISEMDTVQNCVHSLN